MTKENILITGGAGFIGSYIAGHHLTKGDHVWVIDYLQGGKLKNIERFRSNPLFQFDQADVRTWEKLHDAVKWADKIYHMAANVGQRLVLQNPIQTLSNNIHAAEVVMQAMVATKSKAHLLIASTSEVYFYSKENPNGTVSENAIISFHSGKYLQESYPLSKLVNETMALSYTSTEGINCVIARIFNTIGCNQSSVYGMVVPTFIEQALEEKPLTVFGDGLQTRSFSNVRDTVRALNLLLDNPKANGQIFNVGNDYECSILDLARLVIKITHSKSNIRFIDYKEAYGKDFRDVRKRCPDLNKLENLTGFKPQCSLEDTIKEIVNAAKL